MQLIKSMSDSIKIVNLKTLTTTDKLTFKKSFVGCLVLTSNNKILLQQRGGDWDRYPDCLATFGGKIEFQENPEQALVRELNEELGANVALDDVISLGAITESDTNHSELIYAYFWHDKHNSITGCYEGKPAYYNNYSEALTHPKILDDVIWIINECLARKLI